MAPHASIVGLATAITTLMVRQTSAETGWASFCDDTGCSVNCGTPVSVYNWNCVSYEYGRNSVLFWDMFYSADWVNLLWYPGDECGCIDDCVAMVASTIPNPTSANACFDMTGHAFAESFSFTSADPFCPSSETGEWC